MAKLGGWISIERTPEPGDDRETRARPMGRASDDRPDYQRWIAGDNDADADAAVASAIDRHWTLQRCLAIRSESLGGLPIRAYRHLGGDEYEEVNNHPLTDLLEHVNPSWTMPMLLAQTEMALCTSRVGAYWVLDNWVNDFPTELWWAPSSRLEPAFGAGPGDPYLKYYRDAKARNKKDRIVPAERVVWFRQPSPWREFGNIAPALAALAPATLALSALKANDSIFEQGMTGAALITPREGVTWTLDTIKELSAILRDTLRGRKGWHRVAFLTRGDYRVEKLSMTPADAQWVELMGLTTRQICEAMGVPLPLVEPTDATFSNVDGARKIMWSSTLIPRAVLIAAAIKRQVADVWFPGVIDLLELDTSVVPELATDATEMWNVRNARKQSMIELATTIASGVMTPEQAVAVAVKLLDIDADDAETILLPTAKVSQAPRVFGGTGGAAPTISPPPDVVFPGQVARSAGPAYSRRAKGERKTAVLEYGSRAYAEWWNMRASEERGIEDEMRAAMVRMFGGQADDGRDGWRAAKSDWDRFKASMRADYGRVSQADGQALARIGQLFARGASSWASRAVEHFRTGATGSLTRLSTDRYLARYGLGKIAPSYPAAAPLIEARAAWFGQQIVESGLRMIGRAALGSALADATADKAGEVMNRMYDQWQGPRAASVAANEFHWLSQAVTTEWARRESAIARKVWMTSLDSRVRPSHVAAHGQEVPIGQAFTIGTATCMFPGDCTETAEAIACRCVQNFVVP